MNIDELRAKIDETDLAMAELFERRMELCAQIAEEKAQSGAQIFDPKREQAMLAACGKRHRSIRSLSKRKLPFQSDISGGCCAACRKI